MPSPADVDEMRSANDGLAALALRDLADFWASLNLGRPEGARDALLAFLPVLTAEYGESAAGIAADYYDDWRLEEVGRAGFVAVMAPVVPAEVVQERTRFAAGHLFTDEPGQMLTFLEGAATKFVLQPGRETMLQSADADPASVGWHRETRPSKAYGKGCAFCRMLAGNGGVYKKATASFASHDSCRCVAFPSWDADAKEVPVSAYVASKRTSAMSPRQREKHRASIRAYLDDFRGDD